MHSCPKSVLVSEQNLSRPLVLCFGFFFILLQIISEGTNECKESNAVIDRRFQQCKDTDASALQRVDMQKQSLI